MLRKYRLNRMSQIFTYKYIYIGINNLRERNDLIDIWRVKGQMKNILH
jgi:hypothetical protein